MEHQPNSPQPWLVRLALALLCGQLGLLWIQGRLLHRQHQDLVDLKAEIQYLAESLDSAMVEPPAEEETLAPARRLRTRRPPLARASYIQQEDSGEAATKELEASRESAKKAVKESRETQSKLSLEENARKAEEKAKARSVWNQGTIGLLISLGALVVALIVRAWLRRRG